MFSRKFKGIIWNIILSQNGRELVFDIRDEQAHSINYFKLNLNNLILFELSVPVSGWWSNIEAYDDRLYISEYRDKQNPNDKGFFEYSDRKEQIDSTKIPQRQYNMELPCVYAPHSEYHSVVSKFLSLSLPLSCEYMEKYSKIVLCYYLRSSKEFNRYLLILDSGKKIFKETLDWRMKGFAPGGFFTYQDKLFFIKNRDEIYIYPF